MSTSICLNMIVKDEAHVIRRCLDSVRPFISRWVIVDTGSTDDTQTIIREHYRDVPGTLHERPWQDFGTNRSEAITLARGTADYILVMDADQVLGTPSGYRFTGLDADGYYIAIRYAGIEYGSAVLLASRIAWRYEGVLHEYVTADVPHRFVPLAGPWIDAYHEGARSRDPQTYLKDAAILEAALGREPGNTRYAFYLAQTLRDAGLPERALEAYRHRATMGGWDEEAWQARYQAAQLVERLGHSPADIQRAYLEAFNARPSRAEPSFSLPAGIVCVRSGPWRCCSPGPPRQSRAPRTCSSSRTPSTRGRPRTSCRSPHGTPMRATRVAALPRPDRGEALPRFGARADRKEPCLVPVGPARALHSNPRGWR